MIIPFRYIVYTLLFAVLTINYFLYTHLKNMFDHKQRNAFTKYKQTKLFCIIVTSPNKLDTHAKVVQDAWARKCDKHFFVTAIEPNIYSQSVETMVNGLPVLQPKYFNYDNYTVLTEKMKQTMIHLYEKQASYDWYLKADTDTFIFVSHLREFLSSKDPSAPLTFGYAFNQSRFGLYHSGGAGYVWSREALKRIGEPLSKNLSFCKRYKAEDLYIAKCFSKVDVSMNSSLDEFGRERFHCLSVRRHIIGMFPKWIHNITVNQPVKKGIECCSETSISFHYQNLEQIEKLGKLADILEEKRKKENISIFSILYQLL